MSSSEHLSRDRGCRFGYGVIAATCVLGGTWVSDIWATTMSNRPLDSRRSSRMTPTLPDREEENCSTLTN
eukprot:12890699-Prorocentrum_lima.AAC.1